MLCVCVCCVLCVCVLCVCMCLRACVHVYVHMHVFMHACMHVYVVNGCIILNYKLTSLFQTSGVCNVTSTPECTHECATV